jgi:hypothetical protein
MAAPAARNLNRQRVAAGAAPAIQRPATASDVPITATGPCIETALGYFADPSLPVVQGIGAGGIGGLAIVAVGLFLMRSVMPTAALDAVSPIVLLVGFLLGGLSGGLGGLLVLLAGQRVILTPAEAPRDASEPAA